jgi:hypothetical protein
MMDGDDRCDEVDEMLNVFSPCSAMAGAARAVIVALFGAVRVLSN